MADFRVGGVLLAMSHGTASVEPQNGAGGPEGNMYVHENLLERPSAVTLRGCRL